jgi:hypothetical protein
MPAVKIRRTLSNDRRETPTDTRLPFLDWLRMNRDAGDLREFFLHADFQFAGDIVDLG